MLMILTILSPNYDVYISSYNVYNKLEIGIVEDSFLRVINRRFTIYFILEVSKKKFPHKSFVVMSLFTCEINV